MHTNLKSYFLDSDLQKLLEVIPEDWEVNLSESFIVGLHPSFWIIEVNYACSDEIDFEDAEYDKTAIIVYSNEGELLSLIKDYQEYHILIGKKNCFIAAMNEEAIIPSSFFLNAKEMNIDHSEDDIWEEFMPIQLGPNSVSPWEEPIYIDGLQSVDFYDYKGNHLTCCLISNFNNLKMINEKYVILETLNYHDINNCDEPRLYALFDLEKGVFIEHQSFRGVGNVRDYFSFGIIYPYKGHIWKKRSTGKSEHLVDLNSVQENFQTDDIGDEWQVYKNAFENDPEAQWNID